MAADAPAADRIAGDGGANTNRHRNPNIPSTSASTSALPTAAAVEQPLDPEARIAFIRAQREREREKSIEEREKLVSTQYSHRAPV
jgi:hypothetical protein